MKIIVTGTLFALAAAPLSAGTWKTQCGATSVPYQATVNGAKPEEILGGAIIGGVIGKAATGENAGAVVGAVIGGAVVNENSKKTVTRYRDVDTCTQVFVPEYIDDQEALNESIVRLNSGGSESRERIMDVQYTIGAHHDGVWGPRSVRTANEYLASNQVDVIDDASEGPLYSLVVNDVVVVSSTDVNEVDNIQNALFEAGVESQIIVSLE